MLNKFHTQPTKEPTTNDLKYEINILKEEMAGIKTRLSKMEKGKEIISIGTSKDRILEKEIENETELDNFLLQEINYQKWYIKINLVINEEYSLEVIALVDSGADMNCIKERLVPTKYFDKLRYKNNITAAYGTKMILSYKLKKCFCL